MFALSRALHGCAFVCIAGPGVMVAMAQQYGQPQTVYLPVGKVQVARVDTASTILRRCTAADLEMKAGDLVFAVDGVAVDSAERFDEVFRRKTDSDVRIDFIRDGVVHQTIGPVFRVMQGVFKSSAPEWCGSLQTVPAEFMPSLMEKPVARSLMVLALRNVKENSAAGVAGLQKGDLLVSINGRPIGRVPLGDYVAPLFPEGTPLTFAYLRDGKLREGKAPLTRVKSGIVRTLAFGFEGGSRMVTLPGDDLPEKLPKDVTAEMPAR